MRPAKRSRLTVCDPLANVGLRASARVETTLKDANMGEERRRYERYTVLDEEMLVLGRYSNNAANVRDIGGEGVQLEYVSANFANGQWDRIDLLIAGSDWLKLSNVPCEVVYDIKSLAANSSFTGTDLRICGLRFLDLTADQRQSLRLLLAQLAAGRYDGA
jgi:hypothetical protein